MALDIEGAINFVYSVIIIYWDFTVWHGRVKEINPGKWNSKLWY